MIKTPTNFDGMCPNSGERKGSGNTSESTWIPWELINKTKHLFEGTVRKTELER